MVLYNAGPLSGEIPPLHCNGPAASETKSMSDRYSVELIQAISDWQRGGSSAQKQKRGAMLKKLAGTLPKRFRETTDRCYRQIALTEGHMRRVGTKYELLESISGWTKCERVAREFKGGVPTKGGYQGVIFSVIPTEGQVIIDIAALFADEGFNAAIEDHQGSIKGFHNGIGRYRGSQQEVVLELECVPLAALYAWGGYSSSSNDLAEMFFGHSPTPEEWTTFRQLMARTGVTSGARWLTTPDAVVRVNERLKYEAERVKGTDRS